VALDEMRGRRAGTRSAFIISMIIVYYYCDRHLEEEEED